MVLNGGLISWKPSRHKGGVTLSSSEAKFAASHAPLKGARP
jgi:hypothetical protein